MNEAYPERLFLEAGVLGDEAHAEARAVQVGGALWRVAVEVAQRLDGRRVERRVAPRRLAVHAAQVLHGGAAASFDSINP